MNTVRVWVGRLDRYGRALPIALDEHVSASAGEPRWLPAADVILCSDDSSPGGGERAIAETLARYPGSLVVACRRADGTSLIGTRDGQIVEVGGAELWTTASAAHAWTVTGGRLGDLPEALVRTGEPPDTSIESEEPSGASVKTGVEGPGPASPAGGGHALLVVRRVG